MPQKTVELTNEGDGDLIVKEVAIVAGMDASSFVVNTPAPVPFILHAGATVPVTVDFVPKGAGMLTATLRIVTDLATGGSATVTLKGAGNGAVGKIDPAVLDFGDQKVKKKATKSITISNGGNQDLTIVKSQLNPTVGVFAAVLPPNGTKIAAGKSLTIDVNCIPAMAGQATAKLEIQTDDPAVAGGVKFTAQLNVNGVLSNVTVTPTELVFQPILVGRRSDMQTIKVTNIGTVPVDNLTVAISANQMSMGDDSSSFAPVPGWTSMLAPGESSEIGIIFEPRVARGTLQATAVLQADGVQVPITVVLKGSSMAGMVSAQPSVLSFDRVVLGEQSQPKYLRLTNDGTTELELDIIAPASEDWIVDTSETKMTLPAGSTTQLAVSFAPKSLGARSESVEVRLKGTMIPLAKADLDGTGVKPKSMMPMMDSPSPGCHATPAGRSQAEAWAILILLAAFASLRLRRRRPLA